MLMKLNGNKPESDILNHYSDCNLICKKHHYNVVEMLITMQVLAVVCQFVTKK